MLKRHVASLILFLILFTEAGCSSNSQEKYLQYKEEFERIWNAESIFFESEIDIQDQSKSDNNNILALHKLIKVKNIWSDSNNLNKEIYEEINATNAAKDTLYSSKTLSYYVEGMYYTHDFYSDQYLRNNMDQNTMTKYDSPFCFEFDEEDIKETSFENNQTTFQLKDKPIIAFIRNLSPQNLQGDFENYKIKDAKFIADFKNNEQIDSYDLQFSLENDTMISKYHMTVQVNQLNGVTIDYPSDFDRYVE